MRSVLRGSHDAAPTVPDRRVFLHIGAPAAGAAYLRQTLARNRRRLTRHGVLFPSGHLGDDGDHTDAVLDVLDLSRRQPTATTGAWDRLAQTAADWRRGTVVVSHELLADATEAQVERVAAAFGASEVHVVYAARDLAALLPLAWQQWVHHGGTAPFAGYVDRVLARDGHRIGRMFWGSHDAAAVLRRWSSYVPAERVHLLTVPHGDDTVLWERFTGVLGLDLHRLRAAPHTGHRPDPLVVTEVLRLLTSTAGEYVGPDALARVRRTLAGVVGDPPTLSVVHRERLREETDRQLAAVKDACYRVVGDLTELMPAPERFAEDPAVTVPDNAHLIAAQSRALAVLAGVLETDEGPAGVHRRTLRGLLGRGRRLLRR